AARRNSASGALSIVRRVLALIPQRRSARASRVAFFRSPSVCAAVKTSARVLVDPFASRVAIRSFGQSESGDLSNLEARVMASSPVGLGRLMTGTAGPAGAGIRLGNRSVADGPTPARISVLVGSFWTLPERSRARFERAKNRMANAVFTS